MPKFDSKEEYLKWKEGKLQQGKDDAVSDKEKLSVDNSINNSRSPSVRAFYIVPIVLFALVILYFAGRSFDIFRSPSLSQSDSRKEAKFDETLSQSKQELPTPTIIEEEKHKTPKLEQESSALTTVEKGEKDAAKSQPETSPVKLTIPDMVKQAKKAVLNTKNP